MLKAHNPNNFPRIPGPISLFGYFFLFLIYGPLDTVHAQSTPKTMNIPEIPFEGSADLATISALLETHAPLQTIDQANWPEFPYSPRVTFRIGHHENAIWLKFYVTEESVLAERTETNSATHRDSCVEFFIAPEPDGGYYNLEVNCIGTVHLAYGPDRYQRSFLDPESIKKYIRTSSSLGSRPFPEKTGGHTWEMMVTISPEIFIHGNGLALSGKRMQGNFYKCGDDTSPKHYLSWNPVGTPRPDFHQPPYFGTLVFE